MSDDRSLEKGQTMDKYFDNSMNRMGVYRSEHGKIISQGSCLSELVDAKVVRQFSSLVLDPVRWC